MILVWKEREPQGPLRQLIRAFPTTEDPPSDPAERKGPMPISGIEQPGTIPIARDLRLRRYDGRLCWIEPGEGGASRRCFQRRVSAL